MAYILKHKESGAFLVNVYPHTSAYSGAEYMALKFATEIDAKIFNCDYFSNSHEIVKVFEDATEAKPWALITLKSKLRDLNKFWSESIALKVEARAKKEELAALEKRIEQLDYAIVDSFFLRANAIFKK